MDYVIQRGNYIIPIEVKASTKGGMKSIRSFISWKGSPYGIRVSMEDFSSYEQIHVIPLYAVSAIRKLFSNNQQWFLQCLSNRFIFSFKPRFIKFPYLWSIIENFKHIAQRTSRNPMGFCYFFFVWFQLIFFSYRYYQVKGVNFLNLKKNTPLTAQFPNEKLSKSKWAA